VVQITTPTARAVRTGTGGIPPGHQSSPCGRAKRADMIISQPDGLSMQIVQVGRLNDRIPVAGKIPITLIICHDQYNIWPLGKYKQRNQEQNR